MNQTITIPDTWQTVTAEEWQYNIQQKLKEARYE